MDISKKSAEIMLDLVEIKLSMMQVNDRDDAKELAHLKECRESLLKLVNKRKKVSNLDLFQKL